MHRLQLEGTFLNKDGEVLQEAKLDALGQPTRDAEGNVVFLTPTLRDYLRWVVSMLHAPDAASLNLYASTAEKLLGADSDYTDDEVILLQNVVLNWDKFPCHVQKKLMDALPEVARPEPLAEQSPENAVVVAPAAEEAPVEGTEEGIPTPNEESANADTE